MNCEDCQSLIDDYVDGTLDAVQRDRADAHVAVCAACRALADDIRNIRLTSRGLERHTPPAHVWTKLSTAFEAERGRHRWWSHAASVRWQPVAIAASLLLVFGGASWIVWRELTPSHPAHVTAQPGTVGSDHELVQSVETELKLAEEHYEKAIAGLEQITRSEGNALDPQVAAVLQKNLSVIDAAIGESRAALRTQPTSEVAQESLFEALRSKVTLLQETVALINEMRKGNQEGAARIVSGINQ